MARITYVVFGPGRSSRTGPSLVTQWRAAQRRIRTWQRAALRKTAVSLGRDLRRRMKANAPRRTGALARSIRVRTRMYRRGLGFAARYRILRYGFVLQATRYPGWIDAQIHAATNAAQRTFIDNLRQTAGRIRR